MTIQWPADTREVIEKMRAFRYTWKEISLHFGCNQNTVMTKYREICLGVPERTDRVLRYFTPEEDAELRRAYLAFEDLTMVAAKMGRRRGDVMQRILRKHSDLLNTVRTTSLSLAVDRYGIDVLQKFDPNLQEAVNKMKEAKIQAKAEARAAAIAAKEAHLGYKMKLADEAIAAGENRNEVIFRLRAQGISLEKIGKHFNITRERVRQIFDAMALKKSLEKNSNGSATVQGLDTATAGADGGAAAGPEGSNDIVVRIDRKLWETGNW
jgi:hypothetical protein